MTVVVSREGPHFASGTIRWSELRTKFKETSNGTIRCSELFRNTNIYDRNPIVPDSTENDQAADPYSGGTDATKAPFVFKGTGTNWKASLMRNSIKRYFATQTGTDVEFEMGLFTASGSKGIDWDGQGVADALGSVTGNITRNIYKEIRITGTCGSTDTGVNGTAGSGGVGAQKKPAAKLELPNPLKAINVTIKNSGNIHGAGGLGGFFADGTTPLDRSDPGKDGGIALKIWHEGEESKTYIQNTGYIFGGGGGGEQGKHGYINPAGLNAMRANCYADNSYNYFGGYYNTCNGQSLQDSCGSDTVLRSLWYFRIQCATDPVTGKSTGPYDGAVGTAYCRYVEIINEDSDPPVQGRGGQGGNGKGYTQSRTTGTSGTDPGSAICPSCGPGLAANPGGECSGPGGKGGDGGEWGVAGGSTSGLSPAATGLTQGEGGGKSGPSICGKNYFAATGSTGAANIKGPRNTNCEGTASNPIDPGNPPGLTLTVNVNAGHNPTHVRFNRPATHLMVTRLNPNDASQYLQTDPEHKVWFRIRHTWNDRKNIDDIAVWRFRIRDPNLDHTHPKSIVYDSGRRGTSGTYNGPDPTNDPYPNDTGPDIGLGTGVYPIEWYGLSYRNKPPFNPTDPSSTLSKYNCVDQRFPNQGWRTFLQNDQILHLVDDGGSDANSIIEILPPEQATHKIAGVKYGEQPWVRSYANVIDQNPGMGQNWSPFLKDYGIAISNTDTSLGTTAANNYAPITQRGELEFDITSSTGAGTYTIVAASDNGCKFTWEHVPGLFASETFVTPKFFSSGSSWGFGEAPAGFTEKGRIWPFTSEGGADANLNTSTNPWAPEGPNQDGVYNMGPTYFQKNVTSGQYGTYKLVFELENHHSLDQAPTVTPGQNPGVTYSRIPDIRPQSVEEIEAEEALLALEPPGVPSSRYRNRAFAYNPVGVAFRIFAPNGQEIKSSLDMTSGGSYSYGVPTITWTASNMLPNSNNPLHQVQCQSIALNPTMPHYQYTAFDSYTDVPEVGESGYPNTYQNNANNPDSGSKLEFRSDDSVPQGTLNGGSVVGTITPSPNSNGRMEYEFIASNPAGSTTKKMTIE